MDRKQDDSRDSCWSFFWKFKVHFAGTEHLNSASDISATHNSAPPRAATLRLPQLRRLRQVFEVLSFSGWDFPAVSQRLWSTIAQVLASCSIASGKTKTGHCIILGSFLVGTFPSLYWIPGGDKNSNICLQWPRRALILLGQSAFSFIS